MNAVPPTATRTEVDSLGPVEVPHQAYWGASTQRARENFRVSGKTIGDLRSLVWALGAVKKAAAQANKHCGLISPQTSNYIQQAATEVMNGDFDEHFIVDPVQGGAGTSTNMNANEVVARRASELQAQDVHGAVSISPLDAVNRSQSTNDTYPTALKIAILRELPKLTEQLGLLEEVFTSKSVEFQDILKIGRTQLQDAVPMTLGQEFKAFATQLAKASDDLNHVVPKLSEINLGGTAIGTGITSPRQYREQAVDALSEITGFELYSANDLIEATSNTAPFLAVSAALRHVAVQLSKICNDLRLLSSGPQTGLAEIFLPAVQPGSSIMPSKVNPVIPEMINQVAFRVIGNDTTNVLAVEAGQLQLNAFEPVMAISIFESITWLTQASQILRTRCIYGIQANGELLKQRLSESVSIVTALTPALGYMAASELAQEALTQGIDIVEAVRNRGLLTQEELDDYLSIATLTGSVTAAVAKTQ